MTQVALTVVLLAGAGHFVRSLRNVRAIDLGVELRNVLMASMDLRRAGYRRADADTLYLRMLERVRALPGVERAAASAAAAAYLPARRATRVDPVTALRAE